MLVLVASGSRTLLDVVLSHALPPETVRLRLHTNDLDPDEHTALGDLEEANFIGYAPIELPAAGWTVVEGVPSAASHEMLIRAEAHVRCAERERAEQPKRLEVARLQRIEADRLELTNRREVRRVERLEVERVEAERLEARATREAGREAARAKERSGVARGRRARPRGRARPGARRAALERLTRCSSLSEPHPLGGRVQ